MRALPILVAQSPAMLMIWSPSVSRICANHHRVKAMKREFEIRPFQREDAAALLQLMEELAAFEDYLEAFSVREADLIDRGLGAHPEFFAHVADSPEDGLVGMMVFYFVTYTYDLAPELVLKEFYVRPEWRSAGLGQALFAALRTIAQANGCRRIKWLVLKNNERAKRFYQRLGASRDDKWENWQVSLQQIGANTEDNRSDLGVSEAS